MGGCLVVLIVGGKNIHVLIEKEIRNVFSPPFSTGVV
jgi:hypothetical protein